MLRLRDVREAIAWVDRSQVAPQIEALLRPTRRGRPRQLTVRALLVGLKLAVDTAKTSCLTDVHVLLTEMLTPSVQCELGVRDRRTGAVITLPQVRRLLTAIQAKLDPSPHTAPAATGEQRAARAATLQRLLDQLLAATMPAGLQHGGSYAVDGTGTWSWARGKRRGEPTADPDAAWGRKTSKSGRDEAYFGYELHAVVRVNTLGQPRDLVPCVAERIVVVPASSNGTAPVLDALKRMQQEDLRVRDVIADRGYSYKLDWTPGLLALDLDPVLDLHANQYGARGSHQGARIVAGTPHCPAMPEAFNHIPRPERLADSPTLDAFVARIASREQWAFRRVAGPDTTGKERYECPARAGRLRCPLHPPSMAAPLTQPKVASAPRASDAPTCCTQRTITVPGDVDAKARQRHYWGSRDWINAFSRRSRVEGWFGNLKNDSTEALGRGAFRVMGLCKTSLMLGVYAAATNLRLLRAWATRCHDSDDLLPLLGQTPEPHTARTDGNGETQRPPHPPPA
jgi:hypothetical protein